MRVPKLSSTWLREWDGIGANRAHAAEFFYDNLMMGIQLMHEAWQAGVEKFVAVGTVCTSKPNGQPRRKVDTNRARERFGFEAHTQFEDGLRETIEWYVRCRDERAIDG
jgi:nucleoside-diphosphate-sugar epimerase